MTKTGFDKYIIDRETEYLKEKKYIQKQWICFGNGGAYNYAITADGIDFVESQKGYLLKYLKRIFVWLLKYILRRDVCSLIL